LLQPYDAPFPAGAWDRLDARIGALRKAGVRPLLMFVASPAWARDSAGNFACNVADYCLAPPADNRVDAWAEFVAAVAARYTTAAGLEIWNEPNQNSFWRTGVDPARYVRLVCAARAAVRRAGSTAPIVTGGLDGGTALQTQPSNTFLSAAYDAGLGNCADGIGIHPYAGPLAPDATGNTFQGEIARIRGVMRAHGDAVHQIWVTEAGWTTTGPFAVTARQQADYLVAAYRFASKQPDIAAFVVHTLVDPFVPNLADPAYGVIAADGKPKLAYTALRDAAARTQPLKPGKRRTKRRTTSKPASTRRPRGLSGAKGAAEQPHLATIHA
ncbi:MAG: polysaccharide biosynthesis protein PslG, partial [Solirubrobacteraceae bacterium]|nr:polysaccharide biosynthesis protein PslG [Solirubrobacteraceae bacterium]